MTAPKLSRVILACLSLSVVILTSASIWEGTAVIAPAGDLPEVGFYIATNAFPQNTVIDIKNLENDKSVRAIVSGTLDSPGLLASISREAAIKIGVTSASMARIRLTMPADPVAYARFTEGLESSGDPDRDPVAAIATSPARETVDMPSENPLPLQEPLATALVPAPVVAPESAPSTAAPALTLDASSVPAAAPVEAETPAPVSPSSVEEAPAEVAAVETPLSPPDSVPVPEDVVPSVPDSSSVEADTPAIVEAQSAPESPETAVETVPEAPVVPESAEVVAVPEGASSGDEPSPLEPAAPELVEAAEAAAIPSEPPAEAQGEISLEEAEARPPESPEIAVLPAAAEVAPIPTEEEPTIPEQASVSAPASATPAEAALAAEPLPETVPVAAPEVTPAQPEPSRIDLAVLPPEAEVAPIAAPIPAGGKASTAPVSEKGSSVVPHFRVPVIASLEKGKWYLQLGAFSKAETVEAELAKLSASYPLAIQAVGTAEKPVYRVFVGPINSGESAALLNRFKTIGYKDAFVKQGL